MRTGDRSTIRRSRFFILPFQFFCHWTLAMKCSLNVLVVCVSYLSKWHDEKFLLEFFGFFFWS